MLTTANLVDLGVEQVWAKALTAAHGKILTRIGAHRVVYPERDAGERVAHLLSGKPAGLHRVRRRLRDREDAAPAGDARLHPRRVEGAPALRGHRRRREVPRPRLHLRGARDQDPPGRRAHRQRPREPHRALRRAP
ncbi:hypothetical protein GCM10025868_30570 [Angustibacter aerolatus]|uniref:Uncharacterized protein n=1 Tax=Angustibacter aerolatus TaxID=1162965 RepID=A0ABQ6JHU5_9ACTN|nr:hypothetical protein GCM10025868_30570 [Angustibacter aerolatus]